MKIYEFNMKKIAKVSMRNLLCGSLLFIYQFGYANELVITSEVKGIKTIIDELISTSLMKKEQKFLINIEQEGKIHNQLKLSVDGKDYDRKCVYKYDSTSQKKGREICVTEINYLGEDYIDKVYSVNSTNKTNRYEYKGQFAILDALFDDSTNNTQNKKLILKNTSQHDITISKIIIRNSKNSSSKILNAEMPQIIPVKGVVNVDIKFEDISNPKTDKDVLLIADEIEVQYKTDGKELFSIIDIETTVVNNNNLKKSINTENTINHTKTKTLLGVGAIATAAGIIGICSYYLVKSKNKIKQQIEDYSLLEKELSAETIAKQAALQEAQDQKNQIAKLDTKRIDEKNDLQKKLSAETIAKQAALQQVQNQKDQIANLGEKIIEETNASNRTKDTLNTQVAEATAQLQKTKQDNEQLNRDYSRLQLKMKLEEFRSRFKYVTIQEENQKKKVAELAHLNDKKTLLQLIKKEVCNIKLNLQNKDIDLVEKTNKINDLISKLDKSTKALGLKEKALAELESQTAQTTQTNQQLTEQNKQLNKQIEEQKAELQGQLQALQAKLTEEQRNSETLQAELEEERRNSEALEESNKGYIAAIKELEQKITDLQKELGMLNQDKQSAIEKQTQADQQIQAQTAQITELTADIVTQQGNVTKLQTELQVNQVKIDQFHTQLMSTTGDNAALKKQVGTAQEEKVQLEQQLHTAEIDLLTSKNALDKVRTQLEVTKKDAQQEVYAHQQKEDELKKDLQNERQEAQEQRELDQKEKDQLKTKIQIAEQQVQDQTAKINHLTTEMQQEITKVKENITQLKCCLGVEDANLQQKIAKIEAFIDRLNTQLKSQIDKLHIQLEELEKTAVEKEQNSETLKEKNNVNVALIDELQAKITALQQELQKMTVQKDIDDNNREVNLSGFEPDLILSQLVSETTVNDKQTRVKSFRSLEVLTSRVSNVEVDNHMESRKKGEEKCNDEEQTALLTDDIELSSSDKNSKTVSLTHNIEASSSEKNTYQKADETEIGKLRKNVAILIESIDAYEALLAKLSLLKSSLASVKKRDK